MASKNLTLTMPAELVRQAEVLAAQRDASVSGLVAEVRLMEEGIGLRVGPVPTPRDELHAR
jgi:hypothetical protein